MVHAPRAGGGPAFVRYYSNSSNQPSDTYLTGAVGFYRHHDFALPPNRAERLVLKLSTIAKALNADWP